MKNGKKRSAGAAGRIVLWIVLGTVLAACESGHPRPPSVEPAGKDAPVSNEVKPPAAPGQDGKEAAQEAVLTDEALLTYAAGGYDKGAMAFKHVVLGVNHGVRVIADFYCSDVCPQYTVRVLHYDVPVEKCAEAGGLAQDVVVPFGIAAVRRPFCLPKVLAEHPETVRR